MPQSYDVSEPSSSGFLKEGNMFLQNVGDHLQNYTV
jgi:hypothetical protein